jgi:hypothetical protein
MSDLMRLLRDTTLIRVSLENIFGIRVFVPPIIFERWDDDYGNLW